MSKLPNLGLYTSKRYIRSVFNIVKRNNEEKNRMIYEMHKHKRLELGERLAKPGQFKAPDQPQEPTIKTRERKLNSLKDDSLPYHRYTDESIEQIQDHGEWYDPLFNPHLHEGRNKVNPKEEPFSSIYSDASPEQAKEYTQVRNITNPELWEYVERLQKVKVAPVPPMKKLGEDIQLPSCYVPPSESPPDLPYFVARTRNYLLPVYYRVAEDPDKCSTRVRRIAGDLWQFENDVRTYLESLQDSSKRILTSVHETDGIVIFRGKHLHQIVEWLTAKGF